METLKVMLITSTLNRGGIERQITLLAPALRNRGHEVEVAVFHPNDYYEQLLVDSGIAVRALSDSPYRPGRTLFQRICSWAERAFRVMKMARNNHYDVIYGFGMGANFLATTSKLVSKSRVAWGVRNTEPYGGRIHQVIENWLSQFADTIIANSHRGVEVFTRQGLVPDRFVVVPNGIDVELNRPELEWREAVRRELGLQPHEVCIGAIGRMDVNKDRATFLRAAQIVASRCDRVRFLLVGAAANDHLHFLQNLAAELGISEKVIWSNPRGDIERVLNGLDVFVSSSITEGFPNVVAEAMAVGVPCVVTDAGDSAVIVEGAGCVVPVHDASAMAEAIMKTVYELPQVDRCALRERIVSEYSVFNMVSRTEAILRETAP